VTGIRRRFVWNRRTAGGEQLIYREFLVGNGLGGYASGTLAGVCTRRYHGLLVAALPVPMGRVNMLSRCTEELVFDGGHAVRLDGEEPEEGRLLLPGTPLLEYFELRGGLPVWRYRYRDYVVEKSLIMPHRQNTVHLSYYLLEGPRPVEIRLQPFMHFRPQAQEVSCDLNQPYRVEANGHSFKVKAPAGYPDLRLLLHGEQRSFNLTGGAFADAVRAHARGDELRSVIAGYHWFTDWGRDTMISLEGLTLATGRYTEVGYILRTFASYVRDGLIPNMFPKGRNEGVYHTSDATLWFFHAADRYVHTTGDPTTRRLLLPVLREIIQNHIRGTRFGIGVDPADGLLRQGTADLPLTWMDAKAGDWVVTPRRGKAVEINALWFNALNIYAQWLAGCAPNAERDEIVTLIAKVRRSFNRRFWNAELGYLYDVVDGDRGNDAALRPNQIFALALPYPVLERRYWSSVFAAVRRHLETPAGLRTLAPGHPDYQRRYAGDVLARDAAYHQGTVWPWLAGLYVDSWLRVHPHERSRARRYIEQIMTHLDDTCIGSISEVFDAEPPFLPKGCVSQAWSVAEVLRAWIKVSEGDPGGSCPEKDA
jgi:glycogen debranching enzyme